MSRQAEQPILKLYRVKTHGKPLPNLVLAEDAVEAMHIVSEKYAPSFADAAKTADLVNEKGLVNIL